MQFLDEAPCALHVKLIDRKSKKFLEELKLTSAATNENHKAVHASNQLKCRKHSIGIANQDPIAPVLLCYLIAELAIQLRACNKKSSVICYFQERYSNIVSAILHENILQITFCYNKFQLNFLECKVGIVSNQLVEHEMLKNFLRFQ